MSEPASPRQLKDRETFMLRAGEARAAAANATLDNVRDRCLRAEEAWMKMAACSNTMNAPQPVQELLML